MLFKSTDLNYSGRILPWIVLDIIYFPLWWYTKGFFKVITGVGNFLKEQEISLGVFVWLKNLFKPMYGQHDLAGKLISFFMRILQIIFRTIILIFWLIITLVFISFWLLLPLAIFYAIYYQIV
ncbi:MAG: hypothetical protein MUF50_04800 [Planctomycetes bacterium]|jgi:hypothetical protein|nr:hypothetical protein [Planctomycetota bacterium]